MKIGAILMLMSASIAAVAAEHEQRERGAHEHGHGMLNVVAEGHELAIELRIPGVNVVGFEREAGTDEERREMGKALAAFAQGEALFVPSPDASCDVEKVDVGIAGMRHGETDHSADEKVPHTEFRAAYRFHCDAPEKLEHLEIKLFEELRGVEKIHAQVVTPTVRTAVEREPGDAILRLAR